ncbi:beta-lactamase family protein [Sphingomonas sp. CL5.1]|uniref:hypothetical protein n=1 Tax=Sphingomonas sp. CL5.1 TaxID=2653203 RepID=UPI001582D6B3|nr:hypothetical protein [Sphingomonas sp. CL5.1]QKS00460.1 beta-lactamase family protein [Sphingomonas sp. CL5.1]
MRRMLVAMLALAMSGTAGAEELFRSDFQHGTAAPWQASGRGDVRLTSFEGNVSMRLTAGASALAEMPVRGMRRLYVTVKIAGDGLDPQAACVAEASRDGGRSWAAIFAIDRKMADGVTLTAGGAALPDVDGGLTLRLVARGGRATCWFDDIAVSGVALADISPTRRALGRAMLTAGGAFERPVDLSAFAPAADAGKSIARWEGRLRLTGARATGFRMIAEDPAFARGDTIRSLPDLDLALVQSGDVLLPAQRGLIPSTHPDWNWIVEPGRVWSEPGDGGTARAALPFALQERNANCTHNGMLTFLFGVDGTISHAAFEIAGETCLYRKFDAWGLLVARYLPGTVAGAAELIRAHEETNAARLPMKRLEDLPPAVAAALATAAGPEPTVYGAVIGGVHYRSACVTRHGDYPACDVIDLPSYSTAKSVFGAVALMRMGNLWPGTAAETVAAHVPACAAAKGWADVTLENALDMTTGHYRSTAYQADEDDPSMARFFDPADHAAKIHFACTFYPRKAAPGTTWVYHTSDTYLLGTAMADALRAKRGEKADLYDDVMRPLWDRLKLSPTLSTTRRTEDAAAQPFVGWGLTYQPDDIARIALWLMKGADGLLDRRLLDAAMQRAPAGGGKVAGFPAYRYRAGFWARDIAPKLGCAVPSWAPAMSGYGGISVAMLPEDTLFYSFGDSNHWDWGAAIPALVTKDGGCR